MGQVKVYIWKQWKTILTVVTFAAFAGVVYVSRKQIGQTIANFAHVHAVVLVLMIVWQALNYSAYTRMYLHYLRLFKTTISFKDMLKIVSELNFVNNIFPTAGVSGFSYFGLRMREYGVSPGTATTVQLMRFVSVFLSFQALLVIGLLLLAVGGKAGGMVILIATMLTTLLGIGTLLMVYIVSSKHRINGFMVFLAKSINWLLHNTRLAGKEVIRLEKVEEIFSELHDNYMIMRRERHQLKWPLFHAFVANLSEIATIYTVYIAFDQWVNFGAVIIAYAIANFAGLVSVLPGGVGIYEGLTTATLIAAGVPPAVSIPVVIMYRILSMLIQLPIGYYLYHRQIRRA